MANAAFFVFTVALPHEYGATQRLVSTMPRKFSRRAMTNAQLRWLDGKSLSDFLILNDLAIGARASNSLTSIPATLINILAYWKNVLAEAKQGRNGC